MVIVTTFASDDHYTIHHYMYPSFKVVRLTTIVVSITKFNNHYHVVISNIVNITLFCSDVHYTVFTVYIERRIPAPSTSLVARPQFFTERVYMQI